MNTPLPDITTLQIDHVTYYTRIQDLCLVYDESVSYTFHDAVPHVTYNAKAISHDPPLQICLIEPRIIPR